MVVVIEAEEEKQEQEEVQKNPPTPTPTKSSSSTQTPSFSLATDTSSISTATTTLAKSANHDSDGFETASERDLNSDTDENDAVLRALDESNEAKLEGNKLFGNGLYEEALLRYEAALQIASETDTSADLRSICHANRAICFLKLGKYEETIKECTKALELNPSYVKALVRRGEAHEKLENYEEAIADMKKILELDASNDQAKRAICRLEPLAVEKREKMKEEMIGKLKEMGNSLLGRFGMSLDNFKAVKDPNTGSYSISFQR